MRRFSLIFVLVFAASLGLVIAQQKKAPPATEDKPFVPPPAPEQPIPYSHKQHLAMGLKCAGCHTIEEDGFRVSYPAESKCMACHKAVKKDSPAIEKLAAFAAKGEPVPWVQVYQVPDFVWFAHDSHVKSAGFDCATCHPNVEQSTVIRKEKSTSMGACMDCHAKYKAPNNCDFCHDPG